MLVGEVKKLVKTRLHSITLAKEDDIVLSFINLGVSELYRRFNLSIKSETVAINDNIAFYELRNNDVLMLLALYDINGRELKQSDTRNTAMYDYKQVNYRSFILTKPHNTHVYAIYKASPILLKDDEDYIDLPDAMLDALLTYCSYLGHSTINRDNANEVSMWIKYFEVCCQELENQGYRIPLDVERYSVQIKGFV